MYIILLYTYIYYTLSSSISFSSSVLLPLPSILSLSLRFQSDCKVLLRYWNPVRVIDLGYLYLFKCIRFVRIEDRLGLCSEMCIGFGLCLSGCSCSVLVCAGVIIYYYIVILYYTPIFCSSSTSSIIPFPLPYSSHSFKYSVFSIHQVTILKRNRFGRINIE